MKINELVATISKDNNLSLFENEVGIVVGVKDSEIAVFFPRNNQTFKVQSSNLRRIAIEDYGDHALEKCCNVCHRILPVEFFDKNQNGKNNRTVRRPSCKDCREVIDGLNMSAAEKRKWGKSKPHLAVFKCPICEKTTIPGLNSKVVLNHDHATGIATGWICDSCNTGLGRFKDNPEILHRAIDYLEKWAPSRGSEQSE